MDMKFMLDPPTETLPLWFRLLAGGILAAVGFYAWYLVRGDMGLALGGFFLLLATLVTLWTEPDKEEQVFFVMIPLWTEPGGDG